MANHVAVISDDEANVLRSNLTHHQDRVVTLPNGVDTDLFDRSKYPVAPFEANGKSIVFTGAMDYPPNIEAVSWFAENVFPPLKRRIPDVKFLIVGTRPSAEVKKLGELEGIIVTGRVDSTAAYMAHADVAVAPIRIARGVQNKVLEAKDVYEEPKVYLVETLLFRISKGLLAILLVMTIIFQILLNRYVSLLSLHIYWLTTQLSCMML
jgi:glycosyltransferase involved in cell wall biosynthesis